MALLVQHAKAEIEVRAHAELPSPLSAIMVLNRALSHLEGMHAWTSLKRPAVWLATVAGQQWVALPNDVGQIYSLTPPDSSNWIYTRASHGLIEGWRQRLTEPAREHFTFWDLVHAVPPDMSGPPQPRLELYPTPDTTLEQAIRMAYRARFPEIGESTVYVPIPHHLEGLFMEVAAAFAWGYQEESEVSVTRRLEGLGASEFAMAAKRSDGQFARVHGPSMGGAVKRMRFNHPISGTDRLMDPS